MNFFNFFKKKEMWLTVNLLFMFVYVVLITKSNDKICVIVHEGYWTSNPLVTFEELLSMIFFSIHGRHSHDMNTKGLVAADRRDSNRSYAATDKFDVLKKCGQK